MLFSLPNTIALFLTIAATATADIFTLTASLPGSDLNNLPVNAAGGAFYLGGSPAGYCPTQIGSACPIVTNTIFTADLTALFVEAPGGQQVYIESNGALGFTQGHTASTPPGSYIGGFLNVAEGVLSWMPPAGSLGGILACPGSSGGGRYQVYAKTPAFSRTDCRTLEGLSPTYLPPGSPPGAWQYI